MDGVGLCRPEPGRLHDLIYLRNLRGGSAVFQLSQYNLTPSSAVCGSGGTTSPGANLRANGEGLIFRSQPVS